MFKNLFSTHSRLSWAVLPLVSLGFTSQLAGQPFTTIYNIPPDAAPASIDSDTQLNLSGNGVLGANFNAGLQDGTSTNVQVNISGGMVWDAFVANAGSTVNITGGVIGYGMAVNGANVVMSGGQIGNYFRPDLAATVTIDGGSIGHSALLHDTTMTMNAGSIGGNLDLYNFSVFNVHGGSVGDYFDADFGSTVTITGGAFGYRPEFQSGSTGTISGGRFGQDFNVFAGSSVEFIGGEFLMDGQPIVGLENPGDTVTLSSLATLTGTLEDGSVFVFSSLAEDDFDPGAVVLRRGSVPVLSPVTINAPADPIPNGVRAGQTLNLSVGADVGDNFAAVGGTLNIQGGAAGFGLEIVDTAMTIDDGAVGDNFKAYDGSVVELLSGSIGIQGRALAGSTVNIRGGSVGDVFAALAGSTVNISGGTLGNNLAAFADSTINISGGMIPASFRAFANSEVNLVGQSFFVTDPLNPGELIDLTDGLTPGDPMLWTDRVGTLSGTLLDGSAFSFNLSAYINSQATLTILLPTLVGDLDGDGFVGLDDLNLVLSNWNQNVPPGDPLADPSGDGFVGIDDLATVLGHWNAGTLAPPASVPEPVGLTMFAAGLGLVLGRRGRAVCVC